MEDEERRLAATFALSDGEVERFLALFRSLDADGDGTVSVAEVASLLARTGVRDDGELEKWVREMDVNGDGTLDLTEFLQLVCSSSRMQDLR